MELCQAIYRELFAKKET